MAYAVPTAEDLKERYPAFAAVADDTVEMWITDAQRIVTPGWIENDYGPAIMALAAHNLARQGLGTTGSGAVGGMSGVTNFKSGTFSASFAESAVNAQVKGGYASTPYGQDFAEMLRRNRGGPRVSAGGRLGCC